MDARNTPLQKLEMEAYTAVLRALAATHMNWDKEKLMTEIRKELHITTDEHFEVLGKVMGDEEITAIREGRPLPPGSVYAVGELPSRRSQAQPSRALNRSNTGRSQASSQAPVPAPTPDRRGPGRPPTRGRASETAPPAVRRRGKHRSAGGTSGNHELIGRTILRHFPQEQIPWAKGLLTDYQPATNQHTIVYDINTPEESWEEVNLSLLNEEADYRLLDAEPRDVWELTGTAAAPPPLRASSMSRAQKRKQSGGAAVPYPQAVLQEALASSSPGDLENMRDALEARARDLVGELVALAAPSSEHPDPVDRLQLQLQDLTRRERALTSQLEMLQTAA